MAYIVILNEKQLPKLAQIIYRQEANIIQNLNFKTESEMAQYLRDSRANYESILKLLDAGAQLQLKYLDDKARASITNHLFSYIIYCLNSALQTMPNYEVRKTYLEEVSQSIEEFTKLLSELDTGDEIGIAWLENQTVRHKDAVLACLQMYKSPASHTFSLALKESGMTFDDLVKSYQARLEFKGAFENLEDGKKLQVYAKIVQDSKRGSINIDDLVNARKVYGKLSLVLDVGMLVWDIYSAEHPFQKAVSEAINLAAAAGGAVLGEVIGVALATKLLAGVQATKLFVFMAATIGGIIGSFIVGATVGLLVGLIFGSGGANVSLTEGIPVTVAQMPDGAALARQIAHQSDDDNKLD